jgi:diguanylate cyclase (GGDEF)-like protein
MRKFRYSKLKNTSISLSTLFTFSIAWSVLLITLLLSIIGGRSLQQSMYQQTGERLSQNARQAADRMDQFLATRQSELSFLHTYISTNNSFAPDNLQTILTLFQQQLPYFAWLGITDNQGMVIASSSGILIGTSIAQRPVFLEAQSSIFFGDVHEAVLLARLLPNPTGEPMRFVDISFPLFSTDGSFQGVLAAHINWQWLQQERESYFISGSLVNRELLIANHLDGKIILGTKDVLGLPANPIILDSALHQDGYFLDIFNTDYLYGFALHRGHRDFPGFSWVSIVREPAFLTFRSIRVQQQALWITGSILGFLVAGFGFFISRTLTYSLKIIAKQTDALRLGERTVTPINSRVAEISRLSDSIQYLATNLARSTQLAHRDGLTGLYNRLGTEEWISKAKLLCKRNNWTIILFALDLDGFKEVNDTFGHGAGDQVLISTSERISSLVRPDELCARWGGDEFVVCVFDQQLSQDITPLESHRSLATQIAQRMLTQISEPIDYQDQELYVGCSVGIAFIPPEVLDQPDGWQKAHSQADKALYESKHSGKQQWNIYE